MSLNIKCIGRTDVGLKRSNNEDAFIVRPDLGFCSVADGMGGAAAGEVASRVFMETASEVFGDRGSSESPADRVKRSFTLANKRILDHVAVHPDHAGMGCTAEILAISGEDIIIGHIGDSRTYRLRNGELRQLTVDHSLVQEQINKGVISATEARTHAMRHVILRAVGTKETVELDILKGRVIAGDIFLLCSDGLSDMVDDAQIMKCMGPRDSIEAIADRLIGCAKAAGGKDNITVVLAQVN